MTRTVDVAPGGGGAKGFDHAAVLATLEELGANPVAFGELAVLLEC